MTNNSTNSTFPSQVFDPNGLHDFVTNIKTYIFSMIGLSLNTLILIISIKKKRIKEDTYRIIILYQVSAAIVEDIGRITQIILLSNLFSTQYINYLKTKVPVGYDFMSDATSLLKTFGQINFILLIPLFSINRFLAIVFPMKFMKHMKSRRVHIYCISLTVSIIIGYILNEVSEYVNFGTKYTVNLPKALLAIVAVCALFLIPPITSVWVIVKLLLHLRVLESLHDRKRMIELLFISLAMLLEGIYAFMATLPFCVAITWIIIDKVSFYAVYDQPGPLKTWIYWCLLIMLGVTDTTFYSLTIIINIRVYTNVVFKIPIAIYRRYIKKRIMKVTSIAVPTTMNRHPNIIMLTPINHDRWASRVNSSRQQQQRC